MKNIATLETRKLQNRVRWFLSSSAYNRSEVRELIDVLKKIGDVAIFGGMLRDLALASNREFSSDIDLVIDTKDTTKLNEILATYQPKTNAFGGYRIKLSKWMVDLWPLSSTWAFKEGYVRGTKLSDLTKTTFFSWDAIVFEVRTGAIHCQHDYFDDLRCGRLKINLRANPNPEGAAVRALRLFETRQAKLSPELAAYVAGVISDVGTKKLCTSKAARHYSTRLTEEIVSNFLDLLEQTKGKDWVEPVVVSKKQMSLGLMSNSAADPASRRTFDKTSQHKTSVITKNR